MANPTIRLSTAPTTQNPTFTPTSPMANSPDTLIPSRANSLRGFDTIYSSTDPTPFGSRTNLAEDTSRPPTSHCNQNDSEKQELTDRNASASEVSLKTLSIRQRVHHFTWAWYTLTMSTGGVATLLEVQPHEFPGLHAIGTLFYALNLTLFILITATLMIRFTIHPGDLKKSLRHEREGLFVPTFFLSIATIISGTHKFIVQPSGAGPDGMIAPGLITAIAVCFWLYFAATFILAATQYSYLFAGHEYHLSKMMPSWLLPIFPAMLSGTIASIIAQDQPESQRMPILVAGLAAQGLGFWVAILMYAHLIGRLMQVGLPNREHRPALFIGVGPPAFTALALLGMSNAMPDEVYISGYLVNPAIFRAIALLAACSLWLLAFWFFVIACAGVIASPPKFFHLGLWACVFPNSGFTIATISIGNALDNEAIRYVGNGMTICIVIAWLCVVILQARAVWKGDIMFPGKDEDFEDH